MTLRWTTPTFDGGVTITGYQYRVQVDGGAFSLPASLGNATVRNAIVACGAAQTSGHGCGYQVRATNGIPSQWSITVAANWHAPSVPTLGKADAGPNAGQATLQWRPSTTTGGLTEDYRYAVSTGSGFGGRSLQFRRRRSRR